MGKTKVKERSKKQQKYYRHLARQKQKMSQTNDVRRVIVVKREVKSVVKVVKNATHESPTKTVQVTSDDAISIHASDNDFA